MARTTPDARRKADSGPTLPVIATLKRKEEAVASLIRGAGLLTAFAQASGLGNAARILSHAKEDLVYWAVDANFHETAEERFVNQLIYIREANIGRELLACIHTLEAGPERESLMRELNALCTRTMELMARPREGF